MSKKKLKKKKTPNRLPWTQKKLQRLPLKLRLKKFPQKKPLLNKL